MLPSDRCTTVISHPWQHFTAQMLQSLPKLQTFCSTLKCQLLFNRVKISLFWMEFSEISEIWLKVSAALESQGKSSFNLAAAQEIYSASSVTDKEGSIAESTKKWHFLILSSPNLSAGQPVIERLQILDLHKIYGWAPSQFWRRQKCDNGCRWQIW